MMAVTATETTSLVAFTLPSTLHSVQMARFYVRAALGYYDLGYYADDVVKVTSELVSNAVMHATGRAFNLELLRPGESSGALMVVVTDPCPLPPVKRAPTGGAEHGRGLLLVEALSARWGWSSRDPGKAVFAVFAKEG